MELQSSRVKENENIHSSQGASAIDLGTLVEQSKKTLQSAPTKRVRRTKAEIEAARRGEPSSSSRVGADSSSSGPIQASSGIQPITRDRTAELKPAFILYSELFIAKPLEVPDLKLTDTEAEALAQVTSGLMNAFPEYFNSSDPKVATILSAAIVAFPIGYTKYKIYKQAQAQKNVMKKEVESKNTNPVFS